MKHRRRTTRRRRRATGQHSRGSRGAQRDRYAADAKTALRDLFVWATQGNRSGNPYRHDEVRQALRVLGDSKGYDLPGTKPDGSLDPSAKPSGKIEGALYDLAKWATQGNRSGNPYRHPEVNQASRALGGDGFDIPDDVRNASSRRRASNPMQTARESVIDAIQALNDYERELERRFPDGRADFPRDLQKAFGDAIDKLSDAEDAIDRLERTPKRASHRASDLFTGRRTARHVQASASELRAELKDLGEHLGAVDQYWVRNEHELERLVSEGSVRSVDNAFRLISQLRTQVSQAASKAYKLTRDPEDGGAQAELMYILDKYLSNVEQVPQITHTPHSKTIRDSIQRIRSLFSEFG